ncbi:hypothetical protein C8Q80DRAFT_1152864 [Daedaleopsis nitida]|nr:hypothetical protein C8Q80DRAFT_1152864 [Daedaleopsis nitida]
MASSTHSALAVGLVNALVASHVPHDSMHHIYKGKTARSWQQLPGEIIRLITTFYLLDVSTSGHCPNSWAIREMWPHRFAYTTFRDALEVERIMHIFPTWKPHIRIAAR